MGGGFGPGPRSTGNGTITLPGPHAHWYTIASTCHRDDAASPTRLDQTTPCRSSSEPAGNVVRVRIGDRAGPARTLPYQNADTRHPRIE